MIMNDVSRYDYSEAEALQQLLQAVDAACEDSLERMQQHDDFSGQFTININGQSIAFLLGGPQMAALHAFVEHVAVENMYAVDYTRNIVTR